MPETSVAAVTVIGRDRPGIVAVVAKTLYELGCNLEDVASTILRDQFTMTLIVRCDVAVDALQAGLEAVCAPLELVVSARALPSTGVDVAEPDHVVSVYGADQPGILYRVAAVLAEAGCNITDLTSRVIGPPAAPVYAVMLEVGIPQPEAVTARLEEVSAELGLDVTVHPLEVELL